MSLDAQLTMRAECDRKLLLNALDVKIKTREEDLIIRDALPNTDLGVAAAGGVALAAQEDWLMAAAGVVAVEGPLVWAVLANDRVMGFYGLTIENAPQPVSRVRFQLGNGAFRGVYQVEQLDSFLNTAGYFSETVIFTHNEPIRILIMPRLAFGANTLRIPLLARTIEPIGQVVSAPSV
jgi:hypothetical protein